MTRRVLLAVADRWEAHLVTTIERSPDLEVVRRCADLADLVAAAASGVAGVALVSADLRGLDRTAVGQLRAADVLVVGVFDHLDEQTERHLRQIGIDTLLPADVDRARLTATLDAAIGQARGGAPWEDLAGEVDPQPAEAPPSGMVVAVWGPAGAPGRTTVALNLAAEIARLGSRTLLVDADTYGGCVAQALSLLDEAPGLAAATRAADQGTLDLPALARLAPEVTPGLRVLTGIPKAERWVELRAPAVEHVLTIARGLAEVVVVDCGFSLEDDEELSYDTLAPRRNATTLTTLAAADHVLAVGAGDPVGLQRLVRGLQELAVTPSPPPLVVVNKVRAAAVGARPEQRIREAMLRFAGVADPRFVPYDRDALDAALLAGRVLAEQAPTSAARLAIRRIAAELVGVAVPADSRRGLRR